MKSLAFVILVQFVNTPVDNNANTVATFRDMRACEFARMEFIERLGGAYQGLSYACLPGVVTQSWPVPGPGGIPLDRR